MAIKDPSRWLHGYDDGECVQELIETIEEKEALIEEMAVELEELWRLSYYENGPKEPFDEKIMELLRRAKWVG
jgi:hypothetical protein